MEKPKIQFPLLHYAFENDRLKDLKTALTKFPEADTEEITLSLAMLEMSDEKFMKKLGTLSLQDKMNFSCIRHALKLRKTLPDLTWFYEKELRETINSTSSLSFLESIGELIACDKKFCNRENIRKLSDIIFITAFNENERELLRKAADIDEIRDAFTGTQMQRFENIQKFYTELCVELPPALAVIEILKMRCPSIITYRSRFSHNTIFDAFSVLLHNAPLDQLKTIKMFNGSVKEFSLMYNGKQRSGYRSYMNALRKQKDEALIVLNSIPKQFGSSTAIALLNAGHSLKSNAVLETAADYFDEIKTADSANVEQVVLLLADAERESPILEHALSEKAKQVLKYLRESKKETALDSMTSYLDATYDPRTFNKHEFFQKGSTLFKNLFKTEPEKAQRIIDKMIDTVERMTQSLQYHSSMQQRTVEAEVWSAILNNNRNDVALLIHIINSVSSDQPDMADLVTDVSYQLMSNLQPEQLDNLIFSKDLPEFHTCSGYRKSMLKSMIDRIEGNKVITNSLQNIKEKTFGQQFLLDCLSCWDSPQRKDILLHHLGSRLELINKLDSEHRQDFYRFYEHAVRDILLPSGSATKEAKAFFEFYAKDRVPALKKILIAQEKDGNLHTFSDALWKYYVLQGPKEAMDIFWNALKNNYISNYRLDYFLSGSSSLPADFLHQLFLMQTEYFNTEALNKLAAREVWLTAEEEDTSFKKISYPLYLFEHPKAFSETLFADDADIFLNIFDRSEKNSIPERMMNTALAASPRTKKKFHQFIHDKPATFGTEFFAAITSEKPEMLVAVLEKYEGALKNHSGEVFKEVVLKTCGPIISSASPELHNRFQKSAKESLSMQVDQLLTSDFSTNLWELERQAKKLFENCIFLNSNAAERLIKELPQKLAKFHSGTLEEITVDTVRPFMQKTEDPSAFFSCLAICSDAGVSPKRLYQLSRSNRLLNRRSFNTLSIVGTPLTENSENFRIWRMS